MANYKQETYAAFISKLRSDFKCSYMDIGQIYEKGIIAKAAKYKPLRVKGVRITDAQRAALNYGFAEIPYVDETKATEHHVWEYQRPRGKEYNEYYRREDVLKSDGTWGYDKNAVSPIQFDVPTFNNTIDSFCFWHFNSSGQTGYNPETCVTLQDCIGSYYATNRYPSVLISNGVTAVLVSSGMNIKSVIEEHQGICVLQFSQELVDLLQTVDFRSKELYFVACLSRLESGFQRTNLSQYDSRSLEFESGSSIIKKRMTYVDSIQGLSGSVSSVALTYVGTVSGTGSLGGTWRKYKLGDISAKLITPSTWNRTAVSLKAYYTCDVGFVNNKADAPADTIKFDGSMAITGKGTVKTEIVVTADSQKDFFLFVPTSAPTSTPVTVNLYAYRIGEPDVVLSSRTITLTQ